MTAKLFRRGLLPASILMLVSPNALAAPIKVACFGDPSTHSDQLQPAQEYPAKLQQLLGADYEVKNFGDCCGTVLRASRYDNAHSSHVFVDPGYPLAKSIEYQPDIVVIGGIGKHDMDETGGFGAQSSIVAAEFEEDYEILVKKYLDLPRPPIVLVSTPVPYPEGSTAPEDAKPVTTIMLPAVKKAALAHGLPIVDLYATFIGKKQLFKDDYHLSNDAGLQMEAETVFTAIKALATAPGAGGTGGDGGMGNGGGGAAGAPAGGASAGGAAGTPSGGLEAASGSGSLPSGGVTGGGMAGANDVNASAGSAGLANGNQVAPSSSDSSCSLSRTAGSPPHGYSPHGWGVLCLAGLLALGSRRRSRHQRGAGTNSAPPAAR